MFPSHVQQVFFWSEPKTPRQKIVLHREPRSRHVMANTLNDFIDIHKVFLGLATPIEFAKLESDRTLVGAIKLNREETFLVSQALCGSLGLDEAL